MEPPETATPACERNRRRSNRTLATTQARPGSPAPQVPPKRHPPIDREDPPGALETAPLRSQELRRTGAPSTRPRNRPNIRLSRSTALGSFAGVRRGGRFCAVSVSALYPSGPGGARLFQGDFIPAGAMVWVGGRSGTSARGRCPTVGVRDREVGVEEPSLASSRSDANPPHSLVRSCLWQQLGQADGPRFLDQFRSLRFEYGVPRRLAFQRQPRHRSYRYHAGACPQLRND